MLEYLLWSVFFNLKCQILFQNLLQFLFKYHLFLHEQWNCLYLYNKVLHFYHILVLHIYTNFFFFFSIWVFFHEHSRFTGQQGKGEGIYLTPLYHFHPLHRHLDISRAIAAESSPLQIAGSRTRTGNLWFPSASR